VSLCFKPSTLIKDIESIKDTLKVFGLFGGLGSRSRRGFGSVALTKLVDGDNSEVFEFSLADYRDKINQVIDNSNNINKLPFSALSQSARFEIVANGMAARQVHNEAGKAYKDFRKTLDKKDRVAFGLPLMKVDEQNRRASPLFFHVHALKDGRFVVGALFLPAFFHHDSKYAGQDQDLEKFYQPINQFLNTYELS
jgi:CRISPR-associated protein Cmr1